MIPAQINVVIIDLRQLVHADCGQDGKEMLDLSTTKLWLIRSRRCGGAAEKFD